MQTPLPTPGIHVRPAAPLNLSMRLVEQASQTPLAAPFALLGGVTPPLRKVVQKPLFEVFDDKVFLIRPPSQLMRLIDSLRYHKPTVEEREELNLCSSTERLYLHNLTDLLLACGGRKGFRFTSSDINRLRAVCDCVSQKYEALNQNFERLPLEVSQFRFPPHAQRIEDVADLYHPETRHIPHDDEADVRSRAFQFQRLARDYVDSYAQLRDTATDIRVRFAAYLSRDDGVAGIEILPEPVEAEFEAKANHPFPSFLHCLIQKYHREQRNQSTQWTSSCAEPPVDSIGVFSVYLAYVLLHQETLTLEEISSFEVLLQVLKLSYRVEHQQLRIVEITRPVTAHAKLHCVPGQAVTNTTLCAMLFEFLSTVRELRLVNKEKKLLPRRRSRRRLPRSPA